MLIISRDQINSLLARMQDPGRREECRREIEAVKGIKEGLYWRADAGTCCGGPALAGHLFAQIRTLEDALQALDEGRREEAVLLIEDFASDVI